MKVYRVFSYDPKATVAEPGGALFAPSGAAGRVANPDLYRELYVSSAAAGALSEAFGRLDMWTRATFMRGELRYALATFELSDGAAICNLDNPGRLLAFDLKPSAVVVRERRVSQAWAARIFRTKKWIGIAWWSRYDSMWQSLGIWHRRHLRLQGTPEPLSPEHPAVREAADVLPRRLVT